MRTIYAKNLAGEILPLCFPSSPPQDEDLCRVLCPDDPSSVRLVSRSHKQVQIPEEKGMDDETLQALMDDLSAMVESGEEEEQEEQESWVWEDGDVVEYWVETQDLTVQLSPPIGGPYYAVSDPEDQWPLYPFTLWVEREEDVSGFGKEKRVVFSWSFLFSLRTGRYRGPSDYVMEVEGGGGDVYLALSATGTWYASLEEAIQGDMTIPARYKERMLRAVYRKWVRVLRHMARRLTRIERDIGTMYPTEWIRGEKTMFREHYQALRGETRAMRRE